MGSRSVLLKLVFALLLSFVLYLTWGLADTAGDSFSALYRSDSLGVRAIAEFPDSIRKQMLQCAGTPDVLSALDMQSKQTQAAFLDLLKKEPKEVQATMWDFVRYPGLLKVINLYAGARLEKELESYPQDIRSKALEYALDYPFLIGKAHKLEEQFETSKAKLFTDSHVVDSRCFNSLLDNPNAYAVLIKYLNVAIQLSQLSHDHPVEIDLELERVRSAILAAKAGDLEDWKKQLEEDSLGANEFRQSAETFANDQDEQLVQEPVQIVWNLRVHPYPYWFGYPWWYDYPLWYPYPYWYQMGYVRTPGGWVIFSMPSDYYFYWYFDAYAYPFYYPRFTDHCLHYYNQPRTGGGESQHRVNAWKVEAEQRNVSLDLAKENGRVERIRSAAENESLLMREDVAKPSKNRPEDQGKPGWIDREIPSKPKQRSLENSNPSMPAPRKIPQTTPRAPLPSRPDYRPAPSPQKSAPSPVRPSKQSGSEKKDVR